MYQLSVSLKDTVEKERNYIRNAMKEAVTLGNAFHVISATWFEKWKLYVDFDNTSGSRKTDEEIEVLNPGAIDNSSIRGVDEELKPDLNEGEDYILLPRMAGDLLYKRYGGGPQFIRDTVKKGSAISSYVQVSLYRVRFEVYYCEKGFPYPNKEDSRRFAVEYFDKKATCQDIVSKLKSRFHCFFDHRWWIRESRDHHQMSETNDNTDDATPEVAAKKPRVGRLLKCDVTDWENNWRLIRQLPMTRTAVEILGNNSCVELILEACPISRAKDDEWPRYELLNKWKNDLRKDDVIDALDKSKNWFEAVVKQVTSEGVHLHFRCWGERFDEVIPIAEVPTRIQPLHSKTFNRENWCPGNMVEIRVPETTEVCWMGGKIKSIDEAHGTLVVEYSEKERRSTLKSLKQPKKTAAEIAQSSDDARKRALDAEWRGTDSRQSDEKEVGDGSSSNSSAKVSPSLLEQEQEQEEEEEDDDALAEGEVDVKELQFDLMGEDICVIGIHTKRPDATNRSAHISAMAAIRNNGANAVSRSSAGTGAGSYSYSSYGSGGGMSSYFGDYDRHTKGVPPVVGAVGLQNLGNTCFMNSILQCLSNTECLTQIFLSDAHVSQINKTNVLGHGGKLAQVYAKLIKDMWNDGYTKIVPREFKTTIGEFQPQFAGYDQQDSQELMAFLLDGLHEDLNRVSKKPHVTKIESQGRDDSLISAESWRRYLLRNDSEIVDRCFGQLKSHVTCVNCGNVSVTFDEYSSISLPIPIRSSKTISIVVQLLPLSSAPFVVEIDVEISDTMSSLSRILYEALVRLNRLPPLAKSPSKMQLLTPSTSVGCDVHKLSVGSPAVESDSTADRMDLGSGAPTPSPVPIVDDSASEYEIVGSNVPSGAVSPVNTTAYVVVNNNSNGTGSTGSTSTFTTNVSESSQSSCGSTTAPTTAPTGATLDAPPIFHIASILNTRSSTVYKNYCPSDNANTAIQAYAGRNDFIIAFQLEHAVPEPKSMSYTYNYSSYSSSSKKEPLVPEVPSNYTVVDVVQGEKTTQYYNRVELHGYPVRVTIPKEGMTNKQLHDKIWIIMRRFINENSSLVNCDNSNRPYELLVMNSYGTAEKRTIPPDDEPLEIPLVGQEMIVVSWLSQYRVDGEYDFDQLKDLLPSNSSKGYFSSYSTDEADATKKAKLNIYHCLDKFIEREQLAETETLYCSKCKQHLAPIKKMDIWSVPDVLVLHLKRFQYIPGQYFVHREKINENIDFPITGLDLTHYVKGRHPHHVPVLYDLYAVSHHSGGLGGGHYTATAQNWKNQQWYNFNDSSVTETDPSRAVNGTAYVLFYKRRGSPMKWGGIVPSSEPLPDEEESK